MRPPLEQQHTVLTESWPSQTATYVRLKTAHSPPLWQPRATHGATRPSLDTAQQPVPTRSGLPWLRGGHLAYAHRVCLSFDQEVETLVNYAMLELRKAGALLDVSVPLSQHTRVK